MPALESRWRVEGGVGSYLLTAGGRKQPLITCHMCQQSTVLYSNLAIAQEVERFNPDLRRITSASCSHHGCSSAGYSVGQNPHLYYMHGTTRSGEPRYRCKECGRTFSCGAPIRKQRRPELNREVLSLVVNKVPMRRICEVLNIHPATLYNKIGYLSEVATQLTLKYEAKLASGEVRPSRAYISVDRQDHLLNWGSQLDRRYTTLGAIGAVENSSGYVLAMQLTFDPEFDPQDVEADAIARGDYDIARPYRHYARLWLRKDYSHLTNEDSDNPTVSVDAKLASDESKPPPQGMQVHLGAMQYGLFFYLKTLLHGIERIRFFLDRDPGLDSACLAAFAKQITERQVDVFVLQNGGKDLTVDKKKHKIAHANKELERFAQSINIPTVESVRHQFVIHRLKLHLAQGGAPMPFEFPLADMAEPSKLIKYLTDFQDYEIDHLARLYMMATLRGIDRFFMQVRRRLSILERPIATANSARRAWHGYAAYSPVVAQQVLQIFRAYYNYTLVGEDGKTPAMRLGLIDHPIAIETLAMPSA